LDFAGPDGSGSSKVCPWLFSRGRKVDYCFKHDLHSDKICGIVNLDGKEVVRILGCLSKDEATVRVAYLAVKRIWQISS
jgi:hypothetical protein